MKPIYRSNEITVRLLEKADEAQLVQWLSDPAVLQYYEGRDQPHDLERVREHFYNQDDATSRCLVEVGDKPIGYIQFYELEEDERIEYGYGETNEIIYGTDQFIGDIEYWNKGMGTKLVQSMVAYLRDEKQAQKVVMDPQTWNVRAIACYEKSGFRKIKLLKQHELHEGQMRDCWLMEYDKEEWIMDLRYPIGTFEHTGEITAAQREQWIQDIAELPERAREAVEGLSEEQLSLPYREGGWMLKQVIHHMADSHMNSMIRFKLALTEDTPTIRPYYEERWAELNDSRDLDIEFSLQILDALHRRWVALLQTLSDEDYAKQFYHPGPQETTRLDYNLGVYSWHGRHHVAHVTSLRNRLGI